MVGVIGCVLGLGAAALGNGNGAVLLVRAPAESWPLFRGSPQMTGLSASTLPDSPTLLWTYRTKDSIQAAAAVVDGVVLFPTMDGRFCAVGLDDGKERWTYRSNDPAGSKSSPCVAGGLVYFGDEFGVVRALDRKTGELRWQFESQAEVISSPTWIDGKLFVGSYDECLYALDAPTGRLLWKVQTAGPVHCSPSLAGDQVVVAGCDGFIRLVATSDGKETGSLEVGGNIASTPAIVGTELFFGTMGEHVLCVDWKTLERRWAYEPERKFPFHSSPAVTEELVLIGSRDKALHALDRRTGAARWTFRTKGRIDGSPVVVGSRVFVGSADGIVYGVDVGTGQSVWEHVGGAPFSASPAVAGGRLVIGDEDGNLYCFGARNP